MLVLICDICRNQIDHGAIRIRATEILPKVGDEPRSQKVDICKVCIEHIKSLRAKSDQ